MPHARLQAHIPVDMEFPEPMRDAVAYVLRGEYECGLDGRALAILDIGANVGSFALWAIHRWPGSKIYSYEPNPDTFALLKRNTASIAGIRCVNAAVYPTSSNGKAQFFARFVGDGEAALLAYARDTFRDDFVRATHDVDVVAPDTVPRADVIKLDIEGGEAAVLGALDLSATSLVLAEFQNGRNREQMQSTLTQAGFVAIADEACPWDPILDYKDYRQDLRGDVYGHMFYERHGQTRLSRSSISRAA